jgi:hypothetical protein
MPLIMSVISRTRVVSLNPHQVTKNAPPIRATQAQAIHLATSNPCASLEPTPAAGATDVLLVVAEEVPEDDLHREVELVEFSTTPPGSADP